MNLQINVDYVVDINRSNYSDRSPNIIILDRDTGTDLINTQWEQGLHQFLQLKHGCRLSPLSFKAIFISNVSYLKLYKTLYGLTGTLGSSKERELLQDIYKVDFVTIPTAEMKDFTENMSLLSCNVNEWASKVVNEVLKVTETRSALVICETVREVIFLKKHFDLSLSNGKECFPRQVQTYTRDYEEFNMTNKIEPGHIIIATNLAGRGTDIKLSAKLIEAGGLHVCLSFLPTNCRIEEQAFGRAARNGNPGSGQLIFMFSGQNTMSKVIDLKKERDKNEQFRLMEVKNYYNIQIKQEEKWFSSFQNLYNMMKKTKHEEQVKSILLSTCLDQWAFWLEKNSKSTLKESNDVFIGKITNLTSDKFDTWSTQIHDPFQLIKLGVLYFCEKDLDKAELLFNRVIKDEPSFSEAAHYYKICVQASQFDIENPAPLIKEFEIIKKMLEKHMGVSSVSAYFIDSLKTYSSGSLLQTTSFVEQQEAVCQTYETILNSIYEVIGYDIAPHSFQIHDEFDKDIGLSIFNALVKKNILEIRVKDDITEQDLSFVKEYGLEPISMKNILERYCSVNNDGFEGILKYFKSIILPSRELFWRDLVSKDILKNEEKYYLVDHERLDKIYPSLKNKIKDLKLDNPTELNKIRLYSEEEVNKETEKKTYWCYFPNTLLNIIGEKLYKYLKRMKIIISNKQADVIVQDINTKFNHFDSITAEDFKKVGIEKTTASCILDELVKTRILQEICNGGQKKYSLLNCESIDNLTLSVCSAYSEEVRSLLMYNFAFRIALDKFAKISSLCNGNYENFCLPLRYNLHQSLIYELKNYGILKVSVNTKERGNFKKLVEHMFPESMAFEEVMEIFSDIFDETESKNIVQGLIRKGWLIESNPVCQLIESTSVCQLIESTSMCLTNIFKTTYKINSQKNVKQVIPQLELSPSVDNHRDIIETLLLNHLKLSKNISSILEVLENFTGYIYKVTTPSFYLKPLEEKLKECILPVSECAIFSLNGFDKIIILEEKRWTRKMKINTTIVILFGIAKIAVGVALNLCLSFNFNQILIRSGLNDLFYATNALNTGYFSWKDYSYQSFYSLCQDVVPCFKAFYGGKSHGISQKYLKEMSQGILKTFSRKEIYSCVVKQCAVKVGQGIVLGLINATVNNTLTYHLNKLSSAVTGIIYSDVGNTIYKHDVYETILKLNKTLNKAELEILIQKHSSELGHNYLVQLGNSFKKVMGIMKTVIKRLISVHAICKNNSTIDKIEMIIDTFQMITDRLPSLRTMWNDMIRIVGNILDKLNQTLQKELENCGKKKSESFKKEEEVKSDQYFLMEKLGKNIEEIIKTHLEEMFLSPFLNCVQESLLKYTSKMIAKKSLPFFTKEEMMHFVANKRPVWLKKSSQDVKMNKLETDFLYWQYNDCLHEILKVRRNTKLLSHLVSSDAPLDLNCVQVCCKIISCVLKEEGINIPNFNVVVKTNNHKDTYSIGNPQEGGPTVYIATEQIIEMNITRYKLLIKDLFESISKAFLEYYPEFHITADQLQRLVVTSLDNQSLNSVEDEETFTREFLKSNSDIEKKTPCQHSHFDGDLLFNPQVDLDMRGSTCSNKAGNMQHQILKGFQAALHKINTHIHKIQTHLNTFNLMLDDFSVTDYQVVPPADETFEYFQCFAVHYTLVLPFMLGFPETPIDFSITMCLKNETLKSSVTPYNPKGPYIVYNVSPANTDCMKFLNKGIKGHIWLNVDCGKVSYNIQDCLVAGELITPYKHSNVQSKEKCEIIQSVEESVQRLEVSNAGTKQNCRILIIGDSMLKYMSEYITLSECDIKLFPYIKLNKFNILPLITNYSAVRCIVLYLGSDLIKLPISEEIISEDIIELVKQIQKITCSKIVLCKLTHRKPPAFSKKTLRKINHINRSLTNFCLSSSMNRHLELVDTDLIISPQDLGKDGIHLNRGGYHKLGNHLLNILQEILK